MELPGGVANHVNSSRETIMTIDLAMGGMIESIIEYVKRIDPAIASLFIAFFSNLVPYMAVPYLAVIAGYGATLTNYADKALVAIAGGVGAGLAKTIIFLVGRGLHKVLPKQTKENLEFFAKFFKRGVFAAVFIFAALPLPDDVLYIPIGIAGYSVIFFLISVTAGKIVITTLALLFGDLIRSILGGEGASSLTIALGLLIGSIIAAIIIIRMNWRKIVVVYNEEGLLRGFGELLAQIFIAVLPQPYAKKLDEKVDNLLGLTEKE